MSSNVEDTKRAIAVCEREIKGLEIRAGLLSTPAFHAYRATFIDDLKRIEARLLNPPSQDRKEEPLTPYQMGVLQGRRQIIVGLLFDQEALDLALNLERKKLLGLQDELQEWHTRTAHRKQ